MKLSDKILIGFLVCAVVGAIGVVVALRGAMIRPVEETLQVQSFAHDSIAYNSEPFTGIVVSGTWTVTVTRADSCSVIITRADTAQTRVKVFADTNTLSLISSSMSLSSGHGEAAITCPRLTSLETSGAVEISVRGYEEEPLQVSSSGGSRIISRDCVHTNLSCTLNGFSEVDMQESLIDTATLALGGVFDVSLTLRNGILRGTAEGMGGIELNGSIIDNTLETGHLVEVTYTTN